MQPNANTVKAIIRRRFSALGARSKLDRLYPYNL